MTTSVVFLDPRVPDLARLLKGLAPGTRGYVLDADRDGVRQVAGILARDGLAGLAALSLVAHGRPGAIELGATTLDRDSLDRHGPRLAAIGAALAPDGDVRLYACDVAFGTRGRAFVTALSSAFGDAPVSASSWSVGSADLGGTWDLDASAGVVAVGAPFTLATLADYRGVLAVVFSTGSNSTFPSIASTTRFLFGDFNGDGKIDLLYQTGANGSQINFAAGAGSGTFQTPIAVNAAGSPFAGLTLTDFTNNYYTGDFNGDGRLDVFVASSSASKLYLSTGPSSYSAVTGADLPAPAAVTRVLVGDFNSDGKVDILYQTGANGSQINYSAGNGDGTFQAAIAANAAGSPFAGVTLQNFASNYFAADFNGDGYTDILVGSVGGSGTTLYINSASGFTSATSGNLPAPVAGTRMAVGDFDSDGKVDVLWQSGANGTQINYSAGNGNGTFQTAIAANAAGSPLAGLTLPDFSGGGAFSSNYKVFDVDSDGDLDIVTGLAGSRPTYDVQGSDSGGDGSPPTLTSSTPADDAIGISPTANIVLTFDEAVTKGTGNIRIVRVSDQSVVQTIAVGNAAVSVSGSTVTIAHNALAQGTAYAIQLDSGAFVDGDGAVYAGIRNTDVTTLNFTTVTNQAPVVTASGGTTAATEQVAVAVDTAVTVADADNATLAYATVAITGNFRSGEDVLAFTNTSTTTYGNIAATYSAGTGVLTLVSSGATATTAQFQAALRAVTYTDTSDTPNIGNRTISLTASDGAGSSSTVTKTVSVAAVNDAPTATALAAITVTEDVASALTGISFADSDAAAAGVRATFTAAAGTLTAASGGGVTVAGSGTGTLVLDGTIAAINTFIAGSNLAFTTPSNATASVALGVTFSDLGNTGGGVLTDTRTVTLNVTPVADTPGITGASTSEDAQTSAGLVVTRNAADGAEVGFVKVTNVQNGTVYLADGITAVAAGSFITYAQANAGLRFTPAADFNGTGTFDIQASTSGSDAGLGGGVVTASVTVGAVNDAPSGTGLTQTLTVAEDAAATNLFTAAPAVADVDSTSVTATLTLADTAAGALTGAGTGTGGVYTITGTPAQVATLLAAVKFTPAAEYNGTTSVGVAISDGQNGPQGTNPAGTVSITVNAVNDAPMATGLTQTLTVAEDAAATPLFTAAPAVADIDSASVTATLTLANPAAGALTGAGTGTNGAYTITGTLAVVGTALASVNFVPSADFSGTTSVAVAISDGQNGPQGANPTGTVSITVSAVNDAPTATGLTQILTVAEDAAATNLFTAAPAVADVDSASVTATLTLANPAAGALTGAGAGTNGVYTITGTPMAVSTALAAVNFTPAANYNGTTSVGVAINDGQNGPQGTDPTGTVSITVNAVNDAPTATGLTQTLTVAEDAAAIPLFTTLPAVADIDSTSVTATLTLANPAAGALTGAGTGTNGVYTITDTPAQVATLLAAVNFTPAADYNGTTSVAVAISDGQSGPQGANPTGTVSITVNAVNDAPTVSVPAGPYAGLPGNAVAITGISFADVDAQGGAEQVTFTVASGALAATASNGVTIGGTASALTATGTLADLNTFIDGGHLSFTGAQGTTLGIAIDDQGHTPAPARSGSGSVAIVLDNPPAVPVDADAATANAVAEGSGAGTQVGITARSTDADAGDTVSYALSVNPNGFFQIDPATGIVTVSAAGAAGLSHETAASHVIQVRAADQQGVGSTSDFTIAVSNVAPTGAGDSYTLDEDQTLTVAAGTGVLANDTDPNGGTLTAILDAGPAHAGAFALNANGSFSYTPTADFNGSDSFTYHAFDGTAAGATVTVTLGVASVNDAPAGAGTTVTMPEDTAHVFTAADFGFSDAGDAGAPGGGNALSFVRIATIPGSGTLTDDGTAVVAGQVVSAADIVAGRLVFTPAADANGAAYAAFTFQVQDDGGTARGGLDTDPTPRTLTIDVTPVNDPPVLGGDGAIAVSQGGSVVLMTADLTAGDIDNTAAQLTYTVTATDHGSAVVGNAVVTSFTQAELAAGSVSFRQDGTANSTSSLTVSVSDGTASASSARTVTAAVDLAPTATSIVPSTTGPTNATTLTETVSFSEVVTGLDPSDFIVTGSNGATATVGPVAATATAGVYTVALTGVTGTGTVRLDLVNDGTVRDATGNALVGGLGGAATIVDQTAPSVTIGTVVGDDTINAAEARGTIVITGTAPGAEDGQSVTVALQTANGAATYATIAATVASGLWSTSFPAGTALRLPDGGYRVTADVADQAGNPAPQARHALALDTTADAAPLATLAVDGTADGVVNRAEAAVVAFLVAGLDADARATARFSDGTRMQSVQVAADGTGSVNLSGFNGSVTSSLAIADAAGNTAIAAGNTILADTISPPAPSAPTNAAVSNGTVNAANDTPSQALTGTAEPGSIVTLFDGAMRVAATAADAATGAWRYTIGVLADSSTHSYTATATDAAGNTGPAGPALSFTVDTTARTAPTLGADAASGIGVATALTGNVLANDTDASGLHVVAVQYANGLSYAVPASGLTRIAGPTGTLTISADGSYGYRPTDTGHAVFTETVADAVGNARQTTLTLDVARAAVPASAAFAFALTEARFDFSHGHALMTAPDGTVTDLTGVATIAFGDGTVQERDGAPLIDDLYYVATNLDVWRARVDPDLHYAESGWHEGRDPNPYFSTSGYLAANADVAASRINPLTHYDTYGWHEGRSPGAGFSAEAYLAMNPDVAAAGTDPLEHYLAYGRVEDRAVFPGLTVARGSGDHLYGAFDATYYLARNADVAAAVPAGRDPDSFAFQHYLTFGANEGRDPDAFFSTSGYRAANPDVAASGINPLLHYEEFGWYEGRDPGPAFHTNAYLAAAPDVVAAEIDPLQHYLQYGMAEGRHIA